MERRKFLKGLGGLGSVPLLKGTMTMTLDALANVLLLLFFDQLPYMNFVLKVYSPDKPEPLRCRYCLNYVICDY